MASGLLTRCRRYSCDIHILTESTLTQRLFAREYFEEVTHDSPLNFDLATAARPD